MKTGLMATWNRENRTAWAREGAYYLSNLNFSYISRLNRHLCKVALLDDYFLFSLRIHPELPGPFRFYLSQNLLKVRVSFYLDLTNEQR